MVTRNRRLEALEAIYAEVPMIACKRLCRACCGPVVQTGSMTQYEYRRIADLGLEPSPVDAKDFLACSMLDGATGLCRVYDRRPLICRLWGVVDVDGMRCPHGCVPERWLTDQQSKALLARTREIGGAMGL